MHVAHEIARQVVHQDGIPLGMYWDEQAAACSTVYTKTTTVSATTYIVDVYKATLTPAGSRYSLTVHRYFWDGGCVSGGYPSAVVEDSKVDRLRWLSIMKSLRTKPGFLS